MTAWIRRWRTAQGAPQQYAGHAYVATQLRVGRNASVRLERAGDRHGVYRKISWRTAAPLPSQRSGCRPIPANHTKCCSTRTRCLKAWAGCHAAARHDNMNGDGQGAGARQGAGGERPVFGHVGALPVRSVLQRRRAEKGGSGACRTFTPADLGGGAGRAFWLLCRAERVAGRPVPLGVARGTHGLPGDEHRRSPRARAGAPDAPMPRPFDGYVESSARVSSTCW